MTPIISTCIEISRCSLLLLLLCATAAQFQPCSNRVASPARCADVNTVRTERRLMRDRQTDRRTDEQTDTAPLHRHTPLNGPFSGTARQWRSKVLGGLKELQRPCCVISQQWRQWRLPSVLWRCWLGGRKGIQPVKNWVVGCWRGYLSAARCVLAYGPADATATHCLLLQ